jgi:hypothetical protein
MTAYANGDSYLANVIHSLLRNQDAGHEPNDTSHVDGEFRATAN